MSGNAGLNTLANSSSAILRRVDQGASGNGPNLGNAAYRASLMSHYAEDLDRRRRAERAVEEGRAERNTLISIHSFIFQKNL